MLRILLYVKLKDIRGRDPPNIYQCLLEGDREQKILETTSVLYFSDGNTRYLLARIPRHVPLTPTRISVRATRGKEREKEKPASNMQMSIYGYVPDSVGFVADEEPSWRMASLVIAVPPRLVL